MIPPGIDLEPHLALRRDVRRVGARARRAEPLVPGVDLLAMMQAWTDPPRHRPPGLDPAAQALHDAFDGGLSRRAATAGPPGTGSTGARGPAPGTVDCSCYVPSDFGTECNCGATSVSGVATESGYCLCSGTCFKADYSPCDSGDDSFANHLMYACSPRPDGLDVASESMMHSALDNLADQVDYVGDDARPLTGATASGSPGVVPNGACRIEVAARNFQGPPWVMDLAGAIADHTYLIVTYMNGLRVAIHGGPKGAGCGDSAWGLGCLLVRADPRDGITYNRSDWPAVTVAHSLLACGTIDCVSRVAMAIYAARIDYVPTGPNSNSLVGTTLRRCGMPLDYPPGANPVGIDVDAA